MSKLAWVALPLVAALAVLAIAVWRGRTPSRLTLNVAASLLLMVYVGTTAGLGIFWVANQQLPVFDWHYLFGYATLTLLVLHLAFNGGVVWRHLRGPRRAVAPRAPEAASRRSRVGVLGLLGALLAGGAGYLLGLRHGRTELRLGDRVAEGPVNDAAWAVVERFHAFTAHTREGVVRRAPGTSWSDRPPSFKRYDDRPVLELPSPSTSDSPLGRLLWLTAGVNLRSAGIAFRTSPSSGALFASEFYVLSLALPGIPRGLWHYDGNRHRLHRVRDDGVAPALLAAWPSGDGASAAGAIVATAVFARSGHKYRDRTYRYVCCDLGHALENLLSAAPALGLDATLLPAFDDATLDRALGIDGVDEAALAAVALTAAPQAAAVANATGRWQATPAGAGAETPLALTEAIHRATALRRLAGDDARPETATATTPPPAAAPDLKLPAPAKAYGAAEVPGLIERRRSRRRFGAEPIELAALSTLLARALPSRPLLPAGLLRLDVFTTAVRGLPPAAWRYEPHVHGLHRHRAAIDRPTLRSAGLGQDVVGDAAAVLVLSVEPGALAGVPSAARAYRHAFIDAGRAGERLYLAAGSLGLGVCSVGAFYDADVAALMDAVPSGVWPLHLVAVGRT